MVNPQNKPDAPPSTGKKGQVRSGWFLLVVLVIVIIAAIAMVSRRPGAGMGGSLSQEGGTTRPATSATP